MKTLAAALLQLVSLAVMSQSNEPQLPRAITKISPLLFFTQTLELGIEALNPAYTRSFQISASIRSGQGDYIDGRGASGTIAYRRYVTPLSTPVPRNPDAVQGIYYSLLFRVEYFKGEEQYYNQAAFETTTETIYNFSPAFTIGLQRTVFDVLFIDVYLGGGIKFADIRYHGTSPSEQIHYDLFHPAYEGIYPAVGVKIGVGL